MDNRKHSKKAIDWLLLEEGKRILHGRNGKERHCPNCRVYAWTASVRKLVPCMRLRGAAGTVKRACRFETRLPHAGATPWP